MRAIALLSLLVCQQLAAGAESVSPLELNAQGTARYSEARFREAESLFRRALAAWDPRGSGSLLDHARIQANLGVALRSEARYPEAERVLLDSLREVESAAGPDSAEAGYTASSLAALYLVWGNLREAEVFALRAEAGLRKNSHGQRDIRNNERVLASIYVGQGRYEDAKVRLDTLVNAEEDRLTAGAYNDLAVAALEQQRPAEAESLARRALDAAGRTLPPSDPDRASALNSLAQACRFQQKFVEAEQYYREAIAAWTASLGPGHPTTAKGYFNLAGFYHDRGRDAGAEELYRRAAEIFQSAYGENHAATLEARNELAEVLRAEGRYTEAEKLSRSSLAALEKLLAPEDPRLERALANRARLLDSTRHPQEAAALRSRLGRMSRGLREP